MHYFIKRGEKIKGPFSREKLVEFARAKKITGTDLVANDELGPFQSLSEVWPQIQGSGESGGDSAGSSGESTTSGSTCANCHAPVFNNAMNCPKCGILLKVSPPPMGFADPQLSFGPEPGQVASPQPIPVAPVQPLATPTHPTPQAFSSEQYPQPQPGQIPQPQAVQYPQMQPGQYAQPQPVQQQYIQPMPSPNYVQGAGVNNPVSKPAKKKRKAKKGEGGEINHRLIGIACGGIGLIVIVVLFKFVLTPSLEGKADRLVKRLITLGVQTQALMASNSSGSRLDAKLEEMEKVGKDLEEVLSQMTPDQKQRWEEKWVSKLIEKGLNF